MKREIKFRGKMVDSVGWVYGSYHWSADSKYHYILNLEKFNDRPHKNNVKGLDEMCLFKTEVHNIIPESVGQYTGLTDKNGKDIYEGDVDQDGGRVFYNESIARFQIDYGGDIDIADMEDVGEWMIVSGNIYENPELLNS